MLKALTNGMLKFLTPTIATGLQLPCHQAVGTKGAGQLGFIPSREQKAKPGTRIENFQVVRKFFSVVFRDGWGPVLT